MLQIYSTKLCNWAKGIATWTTRLNGPYNPNLTVPQLCLTKMGIMPPCHCRTTVEINLPLFMKSLSPKLWVSFLPCLERKMNYFRLVWLLLRPPTLAEMPFSSFSFSCQLPGEDGCGLPRARTLIPVLAWTLLSRSYLQKEDNSERLKLIFMALYEALCLTTFTCLKSTIIGQNQATAPQRWWH